MNKFISIPDDFVFFDNPKDIDLKINKKSTKISMSKSEFNKAVNVGAESGESGYAFAPAVYDKKIEDKTVDAMNAWVKESQKTLESEIKRFYNLD